MFYFAALSGILLVLALFAQTTLSAKDLPESVQNLPAIPGYLIAVDEGVNRGYIKIEDTQAPAVIHSKYVVRNGETIPVPDVPVLPVYAADLQTVVGNMVTGVGLLLAQM